MKIAGVWAHHYQMIPKISVIVQMPNSPIHRHLGPLGARTVHRWIRILLSIIRRFNRLHRARDCITDDQKDGHFYENLQLIHVGKMLVTRSGP